MVLTFSAPPPRDVKPPPATPSLHREEKVPARALPSSSRVRRALVLTDCVTLGRSLPLSEPQSHNT